MSLEKRNLRLNRNLLRGTVCGGGGCELSGFKACKKKLIGPVLKLGKQLSSVISVKNLRSPWNYVSLKGAFIRGGGGDK